MRLATSAALSALMIAAVATTSALAADMATGADVASGGAAGSGVVVPPPVDLTACPFPAVRAEAAPRTQRYRWFNPRGLYVQPPRVITTEQFEGVVPGHPKYVPPQTAYLASSRCPPALGHAPGGTWYDGKIFYYDGNIPHRPDTFQVIVEPGVVRGNRRMFNFDQ